MWSWLHYPLYCVAFCVWRMTKRQKEHNRWTKTKKKKKKKKRGIGLAVHRGKNRCFISRKTFVIASHGLGILFSFSSVSSNPFDNIVESLVESLGTDLVFLRGMRMFDSQERRVRFHGDARNYVALVSDVHDVRAHELLECLRLICLAWTSRITNMIVKVTDRRGRHGSGGGLARLVSARRSARYRGQACCWAWKSIVGCGDWRCG